MGGAHGEPVLDPAARLRRVYPNLLHVQAEGAPGTGEPLPGTGEAVPRATEEELFASFFESVCGRGMDPGQEKAAASVFARLREHPH